MPKKKNKYTGILNEPMHYYSARTPIVLGGKPTAASRGQSEVKNFEQFALRLIALFEHYDIELAEKGAYRQLAIALAADHIDGFKYKDKAKRGRGRPGKWTGTKSLELYADVKLLAREGHSELNACRLLSKNPKYSGRYKSDTAANLHRRYLEAFQLTDPAIRTVFEEIKSRIGQEAFDEACIHTFALGE